MLGDGATTLDVGNMLILSGTALLDKPAYNLSSSQSGPINFGSRDTGEGAGNEQTITLTKTNSNDLTILAITIEGPNAIDFNFVSQSPGLVLSMNDKKTIELNFNPAIIGFKVAAIV